MDVIFVGAGPGDPELITLKGKKAIEESDVIIYAGSLVNPELLTYAQEKAKIYNSADMTLEEVLEVMEAAVSRHEKVCRLHTGDPSIYGAIQEQMDALEEKGITYKVIPGVSSFVATAAALKQEYTLPGVTQTIILTRTEGRTPMPAKESLGELAKHGATMCIFLSVQDIEKVTANLRESYAADTPVAVVYKASWPDEKTVKGTLTDIAEKVKSAQIGKTAMIVVSNVLKKEYQRSKLYDGNFAHGYRGKRDGNCSTGTNLKGQGDSPKA